VIAKSLLRKLEHPGRRLPTASGGTDPTAVPEKAHLPELPLLKPELPKWIPASVDEFLPAVEPGIACPLGEILDSAADHVREFMKSVDRITATEHLDHQVVNEWGFATREEKRLLQLCGFHFGSKPRSS